MYALPDQYMQLDFFALLPGAAGGRALFAQRGSEHFRQLAQRSALRPPQARQEAAYKASATRKYRRYKLPRTRVFVELDELVTERIVPYWPHQPYRRRRKRPVFVRIELARVPQEVSYEAHHTQHRRIQECPSLPNATYSLRIVTVPISSFAHQRLPHSRMFHQFYTPGFPSGFPAKSTKLTAGASLSM